MVTIDSGDFKDDLLYPGHVYFINTQLLGKDKLLTKEGGDNRNTTFWQTVAATIARAPEDFVLIIDEAHRGANASDRNRTTIMQKFILGSEADGLPPVPLVLGMSATPQRFNALLGTTNRTQRPIYIDPEEVRKSGLLKDLIVVHNPKTKVAGDMTLLQDAAKKWKQFTKLWEGYCVREKEKEIVRPILVVQIEDGTPTQLTRTELNDVVRVIERESGTLGLNEIVHCFDGKEEIKVADRIVRKIEQSRIQDDPEVKVVLFKTALTTGWDCPRAEVMMSFRRAQDPTSIAQLVGRMIRTPLARRIVTDEVLDTVELFLPHYDAKGLEEVLKQLRNPEDGQQMRVEVAVEPYPRNPAMEKVFDHLKTLPTYSVSRVPKMSDVKRALRLAGLLVLEGIDTDADDKMRDVLLTKLKELCGKYAKTVEGWGSVIREGGEIEMDTRQIATSGMTIKGMTSSRLTLIEENIDQLFEITGRTLAAGEGLHRTYWKRFHDKEKPNQAKLELFAVVVRQPETIPIISRLAKEEFDALWKRHKTDIKKLSASVKARFNALIQSSGKAAVMDWELPEQIVEKQQGDVWEKHLFCDADEKFSAELNGWETELLKAEMEKKDFVCWLRNFQQREWALCIPYEMGGVTKSFYPDFVIVRKSGKGFIVDILEPHDMSRVDTVPKAIGLAKFADEHGEEFGRLIIARKDGGKMQTADVNEKSVREKTKQMKPASSVDGLFA